MPRVRRPRFTKAEDAAWRERYLSTYHPRLGGTLPVYDAFGCRAAEIQVGDFVVGYGYITSVRHGYISTDLTDIELPIDPDDEVRLQYVGLPPHIQSLKDERGY